MSQTVSPSTSRCSMLAWRGSRAAWGVSRAGVYRFLKAAPSPAITTFAPVRQALVRMLSLADHTPPGNRSVPDFHGEGYRRTEYGRDCA